MPVILSKKKLIINRKKILKEKIVSYLIKKNNTQFYIKGDYSKNWFIPNIENNNWECDTFNILDFYQNKNTIYIDIGAWIGPTVLYSANKYKQIICFEPDPVAISRLKENLSVNNFKNITLITKALSNTNNFSNFGGNGELGNSMSTLLVGLEDKEDFYNDYGRKNGFLLPNERNKDIITVETITIDKVLKDNNINPNNIGLIKMDIEGGEKIVIPSMQNFLKEYKPNFFISLHRVFLKDNDIDIILNILFNIYSNCYYFSSENNSRRKITKQIIQEEGLTTLVFEK
jgi:FkbM family methyltransferase